MSYDKAFQHSFPTDMRSSSSCDSADETGHSGNVGSRCAVLAVQQASAQRSNVT